MPEQQAKKSPKRKNDGDSSTEPAKAKKIKQAKETSAISQEVIEDIDRILKATCGFEEDEDVSDEELTERAKDFVYFFKQQNGQ